MNEEHIPAHTPETAESHEAAKPAPRRKVPARATRKKAEAVPEPESWMMLLLGVGVLAAWQRRRGVAS